MNSAQCVMCVAVAVLTACGGSASVPSTQGVGTAASLVPLRVHSERIVGTGSGDAQCAPHGQNPFELSVSVSGNATGTFRGTFIGSAKAMVFCNLRGKANISGAFAITSGAKTIGGNFSGSGKYACSYRGGCSAEAGKDVTYSASLTRDGKVRKQFSGHTLGHFGARGDGYMDLTLTGM